LCRQILLEKWRFFEHTDPPYDTPVLTFGEERRSVADLGFVPDDQVVHLPRLQMGEALLAGVGQ